MKTFKIAVGLLACGLLLLALFKFDMIDLSRSPSASMQIPVSELKKTIEKANGGDIASTNRLVKHYLYSEVDEITGLKWARIGAEQGDVNFQKLVVDVLSRSELDADRIESQSLAKKWNLSVR
nr:hypothetical protein [uncultured Undibacterium sp.]